MKMKRRMPHAIIIDPSINNGWLVRLCNITLPYTDPDQLCKDLLWYLKDPEGAEKHWRKEVGPSPGAGAVQTEQAYRSALAQQQAGLGGVGPGIQP